MNYRILEMIGPPETIEQAWEIAEENSIFGIWSEKLDKDRSKLRILIDAERTEKISDTLSKRFSNVEGFRIMLFAVEAILPQPETEDSEEDGMEKQEDTTSSFTGRISREELYADVTSGSQLNLIYMATVILSTLVAGVGLAKNDVAVIIGAMVIAPLLGPNVSMSLAATLADMKLAWQSFKTNITGLLLSLAVAFVMGFILTVDPEIEELGNRATVSFGDITIALAAGSAGALAFTRGIPAAIIGVMVAVALLPPLVSVGLFLGAGYESHAFGAAILTLTNLICINLAGVLTFLVQGIRPRNWWEAEKARRASRIAICIWAALLTILAVIIWFMQSG